MPVPKDTAGHLAVDRSAPWTIQLPNGQQYGPLTKPEVQSLIEAGVIPASSLAWNPQIGSWQRAADVVAPVVASVGDGASSLLPRGALTTSPSVEPALAQLFNHISSDRRQADQDRQDQAQSRVAAAQELKTISNWVGKAVAAGVGIALLLIAVLAWAGAGPQNFNLGRAALLPVFLAGLAATLVSWILPYFYSSGRRRK